MGDKLTVVTCFNNSNIELKTLEALQLDPKVNKVNFIPLRDIVGQERLDLRRSVDVTLGEIGDHDAIIHQPQPEANSWFKKLQDEGDKGKRILLRFNGTNKTLDAEATDRVILTESIDVAKQIYTILGIE